MIRSANGAIFAIRQGVGITNEAVLSTFPGVEAFKAFILAS